MAGLSAAPRARLFTTHGTVLYVDVGSGELRHGVIESSPANAVFAADPGSPPTRRQGCMMHDTGEGCEPVVCLAEHCWTLSSATRAASAAPTSLQIVPVGRGLLGLRSGNLYLCAQPDGRLTLANAWCSTWECFLASEDWCTDVPAMPEEPIGEIAGASIDRRTIAKYIVDPRLRVKVNAGTKKTKLVIYGYPYWSHGRVYYDISKHLYVRGYIVDILNWQVSHASYINEIIGFYDLVMTALDGIGTLVDIYGVPHERIIALSHHEMDLRILIGQKGVEVFEKFAGFGVVGYQLYDASAILGVQRHPHVVPLGVNFADFCADIPERLATVGYAGSFSQKTALGVEIKRGELAEAAAREAGLAFKVAGSTANQISFHDMPDFYRTVDAVLVSSVTEGAQLPVREGAAAGRLVISTPVGDFPHRAYQGGGIIAPIESEKYRKFAAATLKYYKENPSAYVEMCHKIQNAARQFDWEYMIGDWVELIESAKQCFLEQVRLRQQSERFAIAARLLGKGSDGTRHGEEKYPLSLRNKQKIGIICDVDWLSSYLAYEHYYFVTLLRDMLGFDILNSNSLDFGDMSVIRDLNSYSVLIVAVQGPVPLDRISSYKIFRIDDLVSYDSERDERTALLIANCDMVISSYAYALDQYFKHDNVVWVPYSSAIEGCEGYEVIKFNNDPIRKILVSGSIAWDRPLRQYVAGLNNENLDILPHPGYGKKYGDESDDIVRGKYFRELNKYLCCFTDGHLYRYVHLKNFEIASVGSLLLTDKNIEPEMNALGFVDYETCIFCDKETFLDKMAWILDESNRASVDAIRFAGMKLARERHLTKHRAEQIKELINGLVDRQQQPAETATHHLLDQARSDQQAGRFGEAASLFAKRADGGGDDEERWYARWQQARCLREFGDEEGFVRTALAAFRERPHRAEPLKDLVDYYIATQRAEPAAFYAEAALAIAKPEQDVLFVDDALYETGLRHTFAVAASWSTDAAQKERGRRVCDWLALSRDVPPNVHAVARYNTGWYIESAQFLMPSLQIHALSVAAPDSFRASTPSILQTGDGFAMAVRATNATLLPDGIYYLPGYPQNRTFRSLVLLLCLDREFRIASSVEVLPPDDVPLPESISTPIDTLHWILQGFEDPRLFFWRGALWIVASTRQLNTASRDEMVLARIDRPGTHNPVLTDWRVLPSGAPQQREKNWMPQVVGEELRLIYSIDPTRILTDSGIILREEPAPVAADSFRGGSQAVEFDSGWLMIIHEVEVINGMRRYFHRFIWLDSSNVLRRLSRRFYLREVGVEFVAGLAWHPDGERLVISFSVDDNDPFLAVVGVNDVRAVVLDIGEHKGASEQAVQVARSVLARLKASSAVSDLAGAK